MEQSRGREAAYRWKGICIVSCDIQSEFVKRSSTTHSSKRTQQQVRNIYKEDGPWQHMQVRRLKKAECFTVRNVTKRCGQQRLCEHSDAGQTIDLVRAGGRAGIAIAGDIRYEDHRTGITERTVQEFGNIDILVNNAAYQQTYESIEKLPSSEWEYTFRTNIDAMYYLSKAALPKMREGGAIINTASIQAYKPNPQLLAYAITKGAIVTFTEALAQEAIKKGIRVNAVAPGPFWTPLIPMSFEPQKVSQFGKDTPEGRPAQPKEMHQYIFF